MISRLQANLPLILGHMCPVSDLTERRCATTFRGAFASRKTDGQREIERREEGKAGSLTRLCPVFYPTCRKGYGGVKERERRHESESHFYMH